MTALLSAVQTLRRMVLEANMVFQRLWKRTGSCHWRFYEKAISWSFYITESSVHIQVVYTLLSVMQCAIWTVQNCIGCEKKEDVSLFRWSVTTGHLVRLTVQDIGGDPDFSNDGRSWSFCFALYIGADGVDFLWKLRKCCWFPWIFADFSDNFSDKIDEL